MAIDQRAAAWVRLQCIGLPGHALAALLRTFGSPQAAVEARPAELKACLPVGMAKAMRAGHLTERIDAALAWLDKPGNDLITWEDAEYPPALLEIGDPPPVLYAIGDLGLLARPALAIVGSRHATPRGCLDAEEFAAALSADGLAITSGLALGIDAAAHRGALRGKGGTIAVIGTGPDRVYPARNRDLAREIADEGLLLSEFTPGTPPLKGNFPRRNRIISGLARGVLVVEATLSSGSLITARAAAEQGRDVFALPGSIHSPFSKGCHRLIKDGAKLVETASDIVEELGLNTISAGVSAHHRDQRQPPHGNSSLVETNDDIRVVLQALGTDIIEIDVLGERTSMSAARVTAALSMLEVDGRVARVPGGYWQRLS